MLTLLVVTVVSCARKVFNLKVLPADGDEGTAARDDEWDVLMKFGHNFCKRTIEALRCPDGPQAASLQH